MVSKWCHALWKYWVKYIYIGLQKFFVLPYWINIRFNLLKERVHFVWINETRTTWYALYPFLSLLTNLPHACFCYCLTSATPSQMMVGFDMVYRASLGLKYFWHLNNLACYYSLNSFVYLMFLLWPLSLGI